MCASKMTINATVSRSITRLIPVIGHARIQKGGGAGGPDLPPEKSQKYRVP